MSYKGSCLCGTVRYRAANIERPITYCHCSLCRKASGSAFGANAPCPADDFEVVAGHQALKAYASSAQKKRYFCSECGSQLYAAVGDNPTHVRIRLGTLDTALDATPDAHIWAADHASWHEPDPGITRFEAWPDPQELPLPGSIQHADSLPHD